MQRVDEYRFYKLGAALERLRPLTAKTALKDCWYECFDARSLLRELLGDPVSLQVCRPAIEKVVKLISSVIPEDPWDVKGDQLMGYSARRLNDCLKELDAVLEAECRVLATYAISQKGAYSTSDLIDRAEIMIPDEIRSGVGAPVIKDIQEAGRCLVFDLPPQPVCTC